jgi:hypothetical protein
VLQTFSACELLQIQFNANNNEEDTYLHEIVVCWVADEKIWE